MALTNRSVERRNVFVAHLLGDLGERVLVHQPLQWEVLSPHGAGDGILALLDGLFATLLREPSADLAARTGRLHERQPVLAGAGVGVLRREHLDDVAGRAGLSPQYLSEIERGLKEPSSEMIAAVSGALSLTLGDLTLAVAERLTTQQHQTIPVLRVASAQRTCVPQSTVTLAA